MSEDEIRARVFNHILWQASGYDCSIHSKNECFFLPCTIVARYRERGYREELLDVVFDHEPGFVSRGHFCKQRAPMTDHIQEQAEKAAREIVEALRVAEFKAGEEDFREVPPFTERGETIETLGARIVRHQTRAAVPIIAAAIREGVEWLGKETLAKAAVLPTVIDERNALRARVAELEKELAVQDGAGRVTLTRAEQAEARVKELEAEHRCQDCKEFREHMTAKLAAAQSRILALEGALRAAKWLSASATELSSRLRDQDGIVLPVGYGDPEQKNHISQVVARQLGVVCRAVGVFEAALAPKPQASGGGGMGGSDAG